MKTADTPTGKSNNDLITKILSKTDQLLDPLKQSLMTLADKIRPDFESILAGAAEPINADQSIEDVKKHELTTEQKKALFFTLEVRLTNKPEHYKRPEGIKFSEVKSALEANSELMWKIYQMEKAGGDPDIIAVKDNAFIFADCSAESPYLDLTYDQFDEMTRKSGLNMMPEKAYGALQELGRFDINTRCWIKTHDNILKEGKALNGYYIGDPFDVDCVDEINKNSAGVGGRCLLKVPKVNL